MDYYKQTQYLAQVDKDNNVTGKIEKWDAHRKGILHRAFTIALFYKGNVLVQHRKHPAFDGYFDLTLSSHPIFKNEEIQTDLEAVYDTLHRELNITKEDLVSEPTIKGSVFYQAEDKQGGFMEQEFCFLFSAELKTMPAANYDYAYGYILVPLEDIKSGKNHVKKALAPWVDAFFEKNLL